MPQEIGVKYSVDLDEFLSKMEKVSSTLGAVEDKLTDVRKQNPFIQATQSANQYNTVLSQQAQGYGKVQGMVNSLNAEYKRLETELGKLKKAQNEATAAGQYAKLEQQIKQIEARIRELEERLESVKKESGTLPSAFDKIGESIKTAFTVTGILFLIDKLIEFGKKVIDITGESEKFQNQFTRIFEGNDEAAKGYLATLQKTADTTNFTFQELADNSAKLASRGIIPTEKELLKLGDTANFINKPFEQLNEAILDANNPERWKELGFVVTTTGNQMTLSYGSFTTTVEKSVKGAYSAIQAFASQEKVMGSTAEAGKTLSGRMSTLADNFAGLFRTIGQNNKGILNDVLDLFSRILVGTKDLIKSLQPVGDALGSAFSGIAKSIGGIFTSLGNYQTEAEKTATVTQKIGYYLIKYLVAPFTEIVLISAGVIEAFNQVILFGELLAAKLSGNTGLAKTIDGQIAVSKARLAELREDSKKNLDRMSQDLATYIQKDNQAKRRAERRDRLSQEAYGNFKPTDTGGGSTGGKTKPDPKVIKAQQDEYNELLKARDEYVQEYQKLETEFGKQRLEALKKDETAYILEKARLDKAELDAQQAHLLKLVQLAASTKTRVNPQTNKREVIADTSVKLPTDVTASFDTARAQIDNEAARKIQANRVRDEYELLELAKTSYENELKLFDKYWEQKLLTEKVGSAKYLAMVAKRDRDRNTLVVDQIMQQTKDNETASLAFVNQDAFIRELRQTKANALGIVNIEVEKQKAILKIQIDAEEKKLILLKEAGEKENAAVIAQTQATIDALKNQQKNVTSVDYSNGGSFIGSLLGLGGDQLKQFQQGLAVVGNAIQETTQAAIQASEARISELQTEISAKEQQVATEEERSKQGYANNLELRQKELQDLKMQLAQEQAEKRKNAKIQAELDLATSTSNSIASASYLISASAKAFDKSIESSFNPIVGVVLAIAAIATIFSTIAAVKGKAKAITQLRSGGRIDLDGRTHERGGHRIEGTDIEVERGEHVINARDSERYNKTLEALNKNNPLQAIRLLAVEGKIGLPESVIHHIASPTFKAVPQQAGVSDKRLASLEAKFDVMIEHMQGVKKNTRPGKQYIGTPDDYLEIDGDNKSRKKK